MDDFYVSYCDCELAFWNLFYTYPPNYFLEQLLANNIKNHSRNGYVDSKFHSAQHSALRAEIWELEKEKCCGV